MGGADERADRDALRVALGYVVVAGLWIVSSDAVFTVLGTPASSIWWNVGKGLFFVAATGYVLFRLMGAMLRRQQVLHHELVRQTETHAALFNHSPEAMWVYDPETLQILEVNDAMVRRSGRARQDLLALRTSELGPTRGGDGIVRRLAGSESSSEPTLWLHVGPRGEHRWVEVLTHPIEWNGSTAMLALGRDVTLQKRAEDALRASERRLAGVLASMQEMAFSVDLTTGRISYLNDVAAEVLGRDPSDLVMTLDEFADIVVEDDREVYREAERSVVKEGWTEAEFRIRQPNGAVRTLRVRARGVLGPSGRMEHMDGVATDLTHRQALVELLEQQRSFDQLTGLPNRQSFVIAVNTVLAGGSLELDGPPAFVALFDLDRFAAVNQAAGHHAGDAVLVAVGERIGAVLEPGMLAARVGGDEFAVFCPAGLSTPDEVVTQLQDAVEDIFTFDSYEFFVTMSVGLAEAPPTDPDAEDMLRDAHVAMTAAKQRSAGVEFFHPAYRSIITERVRIESELRRALTEGELEMAYQPQVDLRTDRIVGVEALVRWRHPTRGLLAASEFIPAAEESPAIIELGQRVLELVCAQAVAWRGRYGDSAPRIWVNLSRRELDAPDAAARVVGAISAAGLARSAVGVEVTETAFVADSHTVWSSLRELTSAGIGVALDDFGTGWSSLQTLTSVPLEVVKIDHSFVKRVGAAVADTQVVKAVIAMAQAMSVVALAEGVERPEQLAELRRLGCDRVQGHLLGRPSPAAGVEAVLDTGGKPTVFLR